jgi:predicted Zn-dependent protease with MMP-like domain
MDRTGNQEKTIQRYRQHNGQDGQSRIENPKILATQWTGRAIKNRQSKNTGNTMDRMKSTKTKQHNTTQKTKKMSNRPHQKLKMNTGPR